MSSLFIVPAPEIAQFDAGTIPNSGEMFLRRGLETRGRRKRKLD
jgi:hypothetical protein